MPHILYVQGSPRGQASRSVAVADAYLAAFRDRFPFATIDVLDPWTAGLPEFEGSRAEAKMNVVTGAGNEGASARLWEEISGLSARFAAADRYLFAVPMWNGGIPYKLKQLIDIVHQPGLTFGLDRETGYYGLLANRRATLILTSGAYSQGVPSPAFGTDHHSTYMRAWLAQAGIVEVEEVRLQPTVLNPDPDAAMAVAIGEARALAAAAR